MLYLFPSLLPVEGGAPLSCVPSETTQLAFPLSCFLFFCVARETTRTRGSEPRRTEDPSACRVLSWPWPPCMHAWPSPSFPGPVSFCFIDLCPALTCQCKAEPPLWREGDGGTCGGGARLKRDSRQPKGEEGSQQQLTGRPAGPGCGHR